MPQRGNRADLVEGRLASEARDHGALQGEGSARDSARIAEAKKFGCTLPNQVEFLQKFGKDLAAGKIDGYPK